MKSGDGQKRRIRKENMKFFETNFAALPPLDETLIPAIIGSNRRAFSNSHDRGK